MHYSALQCNCSVTGPQWLKFDPKLPRMTDYAQGWHTRGQGGAKGSGGAPGGTRGRQRGLGYSWRQNMWQNMWTKRDGIEVFLMHLGPFGCIATELLSENPNRPKTGFHGGKCVSFPQARQNTFWLFLYFFNAKKCHRLVEKSCLWQLFSKILLWKRQQKCVFFLKLRGFFL